MRTRQRLLHFAQAEDTSGFFRQLARYHDRSRFEMSFATLGPMEAPLRSFMLDHGVECFSCGAKRRREYGGAILRLARLLRRDDVDILHTHLFEPSTIGLTAGFIARTPLRVMTRHYSDYHTRIGKRWHVRLDRLGAAMCHRVIAVSHHTAEHLVQVEGVAASKVEVIVNGLDFERVRVSSPDAPERVRREWAPLGGKLVVTAARLHPEKGYDYLFDAFARIHGQVPGGVRLLVLGEGPFAGRLRESVRQHGLESDVRFLGFRTDVHDFIAAADVLVLASVAEAFGLVLAEALYLGTPVVATRVGGIPEIVRDEVDGILVPPAEPAALARALLRLLLEPALRERLAGAGRRRIEEEFSFPQLAKRYEALYEEAR
jgi:glycosyltransferase involved in cell wall biosynthesis